MTGALARGAGRDAVVGEIRRVLSGLGPGAAAGVAVSGGPDSVALAHLAVEARADLRLEVLHVRHGLRDDAADAAVAARHAAALALPFRLLPVRVTARGTGVEAAARDARLAALAAAAAAGALDAVLLAHTADDQAETVLLNLGRGTGLAGLGGMAVARRHGGVTLLRPLLGVRREDLHAIAAQAGWESVTDPMNADPRRRRTRVRTDVLPALAALSGGPGDAVGVVTRLADLARDDAAALDALAVGHAARLVVAWGPVRAVRRAELDRLPVALARRVVRHVLAGTRGRSEGLGAAAVEAVLALAPGRSLDVAGARVSRGCGWLAAAPPRLDALALRPLAVPGAASLPELGLELHARRRAAPPSGPFSLPPRAAGGNAWGRAPEPVAVRGWRPGDRIRTGRGDALVADLLARAGVPRPVRPLVPVVVDAGDAPLWVPGVATAVGATGTDPSVWLAPALG